MTTTITDFEWATMEEDFAIRYMFEEEFDIIQEVLEEMFKI